MTALPAASSRTAACRVGGITEADCGLPVVVDGCCCGGDGDGGWLEERKRSLKYVLSEI